ncbi:hypothetical protein [Variovorax ginsengisoli]|uniref:Uncharacterized protein n=1 Tax=Variovorax ginsengisoli TaxID=363844 RepID=A0ABT8SEE9_9BURK|nr:hypothetical protein [Variovorax ginsengisoli]MDN8617985.1 hypothetical protein [Variovorax ginsengisoli]MDO1537155.1 hypothetical protein [Variovorax ginsengisoli]
MKPASHEPGWQPIALESQSASNRHEKANLAQNRDCQVVVRVRFFEAITPMPTNYELLEHDREWCEDLERRIAAGELPTAHQLDEAAVVLARSDQGKFALLRRVHAFWKLTGLISIR